MAMKTKKKFFKNAKKVFINNIATIRCTFPYSRENIEEIKQTQGRKWDNKDKCWYLPLTMNNLFYLRENRYRLCPELARWGNERWKIEYNKIPKIDLPTFKGELFHYQNDGLFTINNFHGRALLADDMGLGKTAQAIAWMNYAPGLRPVVVVCPAYLKLNWERELRMWLGDNIEIQIPSGKTINEKLEKDIIIINYDILEDWLPEIKKRSILMVVLDEAHYIKSGKAKRSKATKKLCKGVQSVLGLTGTPIEKVTWDIYNIINIIDPTIFPNSWDFKMKYCGATHNGYGWQFNGSTNNKELNKILIDRCMIRRLKKDVLKDLPDKTFSFIPLEINNRKEYNTVEYNVKEYINNLVDKEISETFTNADELLQEVTELKEDKIQAIKQAKLANINPLTQLNLLKTIASKGKLQSTIEWISNFLESNEKLIIFCEHIEYMESIQKAFPNISVMINGKTTIKNRHKYVDTFQTNNKIRLFIGNKAAETGITLTAASHVAIAEFPWTPGSLKQRIDRAHRIGQKYNVNVYYLMAIDTIEEKIAYSLDKAQQIIDAVLDGRKTPKNDLITYLIHEYRTTLQRL